MVDWGPFSDKGWEEEEPKDNFWDFGDSPKDAHKAESPKSQPAPPAAPPLHGMKQPLRKAPFIDAPPGVIQSPSQVPAPAKSGKRRVLIIDDNLLVRRNHKLLLEKFGFEVVEAIDGRNGLDKLKACGVGNISLVIVDLMMPVMSGEEFVSQAKTAFGEVLPPVWVCTVSGEAPIVKALVAKGIAGYLLKPVQFRTFAQKLQALFPDMDIKIPGEPPPVR